MKMQSNISRFGTRRCSVCNERVPSDSVNPFGLMKYRLVHFNSSNLDEMEHISQDFKGFVATVMDKIQQTGEGLAGLREQDKLGDYIKQGSALFNQIQEQGTTWSERIRAEMILGKQHGKEMVFEDLLTSK
eukprot:TRINITY_DN11761_c0_g1_i2.p1 TRINITY_DN11761_c0_g1~~TRINITY_DN11761_c0_g1_i2.p1  ORF type:complete len:131 (-),score=24.21 TRINITY_DN11761_c0_g1_i2:46-438(-)